MGMALGPQLPIRLTETQDSRLTAVASKTGASKSSLVRLLIDTFLEQCVQQDGTVQLPPDWQAMMAPADARSRLRIPPPEVVRLNDSPAEIPTGQRTPVDYRKELAKDRKKAAGKVG